MESLGIDFPKEKAAPEDGFAWIFLTAYIGGMSDLEPSGRPKQPPVIPIFLGMLTLLWVWYFFSRTPDWESVGLGAVTAGFLVGWIMEKTENKLPDFMAKALQYPPRRDS